MSDEADRAAVQEEAYRSAALAQRRIALPPIGQCHNCGEEVGAQQIFCDRECRDDWQRADSARRRNGVPE